MLFKSKSTRTNVCRKLLSLGRMGALSTRYKDIYDIFYLINTNKLDKEKTKSILDLLCSCSKRKPDSLLELQLSVESALHNKSFINDASRPIYKWIDNDISEIINTILFFIIHTQSV